MLTSAGTSDDKALISLVNDLEAWDAEVLLILDDFHVIEDGAVVRGVDFFIANLPSNVHLMLSTRTDPPLPLARLRARGELVEVRSADLRFTDSETGEYLSRTMGLALTDTDVDTLAHRTEGWAAALQLVGLSLQDRDDVSPAIARFAGDERFIVDFLVDEVLERQPDTVRDFLLATSVLEELTGPLCDAVTGQTNGSATLVEFERANLFLVPLDDRREWYRYHHLFADVLRSHVRGRSPQWVAGLHLRAAQWLQEAGDTEEAIRHALAGGDLDRAAELMEMAMPAMQRNRREAELAEWVRVIPDEMLLNRPVLAVGFIGALAQVSAFETVGARLDAVEELLRPNGGPWPEEAPPGVVVVDTDRYRSVPASVELDRAALALVNGDPETTVTHAREALSLAPSDDDLVRAAAGALAGLASWGLGDIAGAVDAYSESVVGLRRSGHVVDVLGLCIALGDLRRVQGRLGEALGVFTGALDDSAPAPGVAQVRGTADMHTGVAGVLLERNDLRGATEHLAMGERLGEFNGLPQNAYRCRVAAARLREAQGDLSGALVLLDEADQMYNGDYSPNVQPVPAVRARFQLRCGDLRAAESWVDDARVSDVDEPSYLREYEHLTFARVLLARYNADGRAESLDKARVLLERLHTAAVAGDRLGTVIDVLVAQALAHKCGGDQPAALDALRRALQLGRIEGYVRVFADEGDQLTDLLQSLMAQGTGSEAAHARQVLAAGDRSEESASVTPDPQVDPLSDREQDVLRLLATDLTGPEIAREMHISLNTLRTHTRHIFSKLQVSSRRAAVRQAVDLGLLS